MKIRNILLGLFFSISIINASRLSLSDLDTDKSSDESQFEPIKAITDDNLKENTPRNSFYRHLKKKRQIKES